MTFGIDPSAGYGDLVSVEAFADFDTRFKIDWGDGSFDRVRQRGEPRVNGDRYTRLQIHDYSHDGTFDVAVTAVKASLPAIHFQAFLYDHDTAGLTINSSDLQDVVVAGSGTNMINTAGGDDVVLGGSGVDHISGGAGNDDLHGLGGDDVLTGGEGDDVLIGENGDDQLFGGKGDDYIDGYIGVDRLSGGSGADIFVIGSFYDTGSDEILDFSGARGQGDKIDLQAQVNYKFIGGDQFDGKGAELREVQGATASDHIIQGDQNGDGKGDFSFTVHGDVVRIEDFVNGVYAAHASGPAFDPAMMAEAHPAFAGAHMTGHLAIA